MRDWISLVRQPRNVNGQWLPEFRLPKANESPVAGFKCLPPIEPSSLDRRGKSLKRRPTRQDVRASGAFRSYVRRTNPGSPYAPICKARRDFRCHKVARIDTSSPLTPARKSSNRVLSPRLNESGSPSSRSAVGFLSFGPNKSLLLVRANSVSQSLCGFYSRGGSRSVPRQPDASQFVPAIGCSRNLRLTLAVCGRRWNRVRALVGIGEAMPVLLRARCKKRSTGRIPRARGRDGRRPLNSAN